MSTILAAINLVIAMGWGALRIWKMSKENLPVVDRVKKVRDELAAILNKLEKLAEKTKPTWDDTLAGSLSIALEAIAEAIIAQLEEE